MFKLAQYLKGRLTQRTALRFKSPATAAFDSRLGQTLLQYGCMLVIHSNAAPLWVSAAVLYRTSRLAGLLRLRAGGVETEHHTAGQLLRTGDEHLRHQRLPVVCRGLPCLLGRLVHGADARRGEREDSQQARWCCSVRQEGRRARAAAHA